MRTRFNLVGDTFTHLTNGNKGYSVHGKESKYIKWVKDHPLAEGTFYIDNTINDGIGDGRKGLKYLWLLESKHIKPGLVESIIDNKQPEWIGFNLYTGLTDFVFGNIIVT